MMQPETQLAYKLLYPLIYGDEQDRQRALLSVQAEDFSDETVKEVFSAVSHLLRKHPQADDAVLLKALDANTLKAIVTAWQEMPALHITGQKLEDTLSAFRYLRNQQQIRNAVTALTFSKEIHTADFQKLMQLSENLMQTEQQSPAEKYLAAYDQTVPLLSTGFAELDEMLGGGLAAGTVATIGARPSVGKTTFSLNIAAAHPDKKVLFFSIEMTAHMIYARLIANKAEVYYSETVKHRVPIATVKAVLNQYPDLLLVDDVSSVEDIADSICSYKPDLVIIDFVQIVTSDRRFVDNRQRIDYISQRLKQTAKAVGCCLIILSQLTRAGKDKPTMSDLKESGGLEQDSDYVFLLHRPYVQDKSSGEYQPEDTTVICDKNKFGSTGELKFIFEGKYQRFSAVSGGNIKRPTRTAAVPTEDLPI